MCFCQECYKSDACPQQLHHIRRPVKLPLCWACDLWPLGKCAVCQFSPLERFYPSHVLIDTLCGDSVNSAFSSNSCPGVEASLGDICLKQLLMWRLINYDFLTPSLFYLSYYWDSMGRKRTFSPPCVCVWSVWFHGFLSFLQVITYCGHWFWHSDCSIFAH